LLRLSEEFYERRYGVRTTAWLKPEQLGIADRDACDYVPMPYRVLHQMYRKLDIRPGAGEVLVDMGCGMGRPLAVASRYPFRRIIGVEISPELCKVAHLNLTNCQPRARCRQFEVVNANALSYIVPDDATVVFFYNPFRGETLRCVIENIRQSLVRRPRSLRIIYGNRVFFDEETAGMTWLSLSSMPQPQMISGTSTAASTSLTVWAHCSGVRLPPSGWASTRRKQMRSAPNSTALRAHLAGLARLSP
jgi:SAM-dependent methyltransferase